MIFLDHRFTIPNFPSRLLAYMQAGLPVLACTDVNTDIGKVIVNAGFGWWCESNDSDGFIDIIRVILDKVDSVKKEKEFAFLKEYYDTSRAFNIINDHFI